MLIMNQRHQPPDYLDQKHRLVDSIAMDTQLNMDRETRAVGNIAMNTQLNIARKSRAVGNIAMDTRHSHIMGQKPRAVKAAVHILRLFQTSKTIPDILSTYLNRQPGCAAGLRSQAA
ncbi:unnamed protein product [Parnassius apollo]|uniref:(apollo) hypothetical protein n=1 Tax=Parnassius apollo TaxID=110799 RepID=A0A8S3W4K9_PARAO|nr:unnamed protein product [Parnassius apollo]